MIFSQFLEVVGLPHKCITSLELISMRPGASGRKSYYCNCWAASHGYSAYPAMNSEDVILMVVIGWLGAGVQRNPARC